MQRHEANTLAGRNRSLRLALGLSCARKAHEALPAISFAPDTAAGRPPPHLLTVHNCLLRQRLT